MKNYIKRIKKAIRALKEDNDNKITLVIISALRESIIIKVEIGTDFYEFEGTKYFLNRECSIYFDGQETIIFKRGYSEPIHPNSSTYEQIFSKELLDALDNNVVSDFRLSENMDELQEMNKKLKIIMYVSVGAVVGIVIIYNKFMPLLETIIEKLSGFVVG